MSSLTSIRKHCLQDNHGSIPIEADQTFMNSVDDDQWYEIPDISILDHDVLCKIFECQILSAKDLLSFRLVCVSWNQAATSALLKRDGCEIHLDSDLTDLINIFIPQTKKYKQRRHYDFFRGNPPYDRWLLRPRASEKDLPHEPLYVKDLTDIILNSNKFPATSLRFSPGCVLNFLPQTQEKENPDIFEFLNVYGDKIRSISLGNLGAGPSVHELLVKYTPNCRFLDMQHVMSLNSSADTSNSGDPEQFYSRPLNLHSLRLPGRSRDPSVTEAVVRIVESSPQLRGIENVTMKNVESILVTGKGSIIKSFNFEPLPSTLDIGLKVVSSNPRLTHFTASLSRISGTEEFCKMYSMINSFLVGSKDSLKYLAFNVDPFAFLRIARIEIPSLENLTCLRLWDFTSFQYGYRKSMLPYLKTNSIFKVEFEQGSGVNPFPKLRRVELSLNDYTNNILGFFSHRIVNGDDVEFVPIVVPSVVEVSLIYDKSRNAVDRDTIFKLFPNANKKIGKYTVEMEN